MTTLDVRQSLSALFFCCAVAGCGPSRPAPHVEPVIDETLAAASVIPPASARACAECHEREYREWLASQHAHANRLVSDDEDAGAFTPDRTVEEGSFTTTMSHPASGVFRFIAAFSNQTPSVHDAEAVIGITPLRQYLVPFPGGRLQTVDVSYDPRSNDWFNAQGSENRQPHEWGFWKNRSMTWNVQCAFCHMTGFEKNYDIDTDAYASTWKAMGISCAQCHGDMTAHMENPGAPVDASVTASSDMIMDNCASCHARREELFGTFQPGDRFHDHFRLILPDQPGIFHADGQVLDEDFEYASFQMSRMALKGVTCLDCHNPHSGKLVLPVENNAICMQCHTPPGRLGAIPIVPEEHSFHAPDSTGNQCVNCHMSVNYYMVRDGRRDHGFTSPDPRLTIEYGIPNACNRCHDDQTPEWAEEWTQQWYGDKMNRRARDRARLVARYYEEEQELGAELIAMAGTEEIPAWRAALVSMLNPWMDNPAVRAFAASELTHPHPLVRASAVKSFHNVPDSYADIAPLTRDAYALVRIDAALHTLNPLERDVKAYRELRAYTDNGSDQPAGALRQARIALTEGRAGEAVTWAEKAYQWDPSGVPAYTLGRIYFQIGQITNAIHFMEVAAIEDAVNAEYSYSLALAMAEAGRPDDAVQWLRTTVERAPMFGRAWYNLGLAYSGRNRLDEALEALQRAEVLLTDSPDPAYAAATIHARLQDGDAAFEAARRALERAPDHMPSMRLIQSLPRNRPGQ